MKNWLFIIGTAIAVCASVAFLVIGAGWNVWLIAILYTLIYTAIKEW